MSLFLAVKGVTALDIPFNIKRAREVMQSGNYTYARKLLGDVLKVQPGNVTALGLFLEVVKRKEKRKGSAFGLLKGSVAGFLSEVMSLAGKGSSAILIALTNVEANPDDMQALKSLGEAERKAGHNEAAILAYEKAREIAANDTIILRALGRLYAEIGDVRRAYGRYRELLGLEPLDREATNELKNLAALGAIKDRWEEGESFVEKVKDIEEATRLHDEQKIARTTEDVEKAILQTQAQIEKEPTRPGLYLKLGDLYRRTGDLSKAGEAYRQGLTQDDKNFELLARLGDIGLEAIHRELIACEEKSKASPANESLVKTAEAKRMEWLSACVEEFRKRLFLHPTDPLIQYQLAEYCYASGNYKDAIVQLQKCAADIRVKQKALNLLGLCFAQEGLLDYATEQFERAVKDLAIVSSVGKDILYNLGCTYQRLGKWKEAEQAFKRIYEVDIGYKDIESRMKEAYQKAREESPSKT